MDLLPSEFRDVALLRRRHHFFQLGIIFMSSHSKRQLCDGNLLIWSDQPSHMTVYTGTYGRAIGTHYPKYAKTFAGDVVFVGTTDTIQEAVSLLLSMITTGQRTCTLFLAVRQHLNIAENMMLNGYMPRQLQVEGRDLR